MSKLANFNMLNPSDVLKKSSQTKTIRKNLANLKKSQALSRGFGKIAIAPDSYYDGKPLEIDEISRNNSGNNSINSSSSDETSGSTLSQEGENLPSSETSESLVETKFDKLAISKSFLTYLARIERLKATISNWDKFLESNGISRPDFFCRYRERESYQQIIDEFHEVTRRHREGLIRALKNRQNRPKNVKLAPKAPISSNNVSNYGSLGRNLGNKIGEKLNSNQFEGFEERQRSHSQLSFSAKSPDSGLFDASSSGNAEAAHLHQQLKNLSSELVTLRNHFDRSLHNNNNHNNNNNSSSNNNSNSNSNNNVPNGQSNGQIVNRSNSNISNGIFPTPTHPVPVQHRSGGGNIHNYPNKPLPPRPTQQIISNGHHNMTNGNGNGNGPQQQQSNGLNSTSNSSSGGYYVNSKVIRACSTSEGKPSGSLIGTVTTTTEATPSESSYKLSANSTSVSNQAKKQRLSDIEDLIHLSGPLTEDALIRCLQSRCGTGKNYAYMGPILLLANPLTTLGNPLTLTSMKSIGVEPELQKVVAEALRQQCESGYPQVIILSGAVGSGKTYTSMLVLRELFEIAGGGVETDAFKHLSASINVLRSLGTARTASNMESSRIGHFIEVQVTDGSVYRTKVHCYFLDQSRVVRSRLEEKNYHIFYQLLAGLSAEEREKLHLGDHTPDTLRYLNLNNSNMDNRRWDKTEDARRFFEWKSSLHVLGIPFLDVVRVLVAVILLGNVQFSDSTSNCSVDEMEIEGELELQSSAQLLGVSETALRQGLTTRTHNLQRNQLVRSKCDANGSNFARDSLAKSLYTRTVATIVRRANSLKRLCSTSGTLSSDSADSIHNQMEVQSQHASTVGTAGSKASKSMTALNNAVRHATDGFIGILDMFGFEDVKPSHLEHLCINLCAETMQHFYNTHIFKACIESCRDEGINCDWEFDYVDNVPCIDLISSLRTGLLSMLDVECSMRGSVECYVQKVRAHHKSNPRFLDTSRGSDLRVFAIQHYAGKVQYDASDFIDTNRDILSDDLVAVFHKHRCSFGFASHLFSSELKILGAGGIEPCPRGISFRISPTSHTELLNGEEPMSTLTQDFHTRLDNLLRTLVHARPHFIRCIKINHSEQPDLFDRHSVSKQLRAFQVLETVNLMANGYPHRMRFKAFNSRYKLLAPFGRLSRTDDRATDDCQLILECFDNSLDICMKERLVHVSISWAVGKRHIFLSEGARQQLEILRTSTRNRAATSIQSLWRGFRTRIRWPNASLNIRNRNSRYSNHNNISSSNSNSRNYNQRHMNMNMSQNGPPPIPTSPPPLLNVHRNNATMSTATIHQITPLMNSNSSSISPTTAPPNSPSNNSNSASSSAPGHTNSNSNSTAARMGLNSNFSSAFQHHQNSSRNTHHSNNNGNCLSSASASSMSPPGQGQGQISGSGSMAPPLPAPRISSQNSSNLNNLPSTSSQNSSSASTSNRPRPQPIAGTPPPDFMDRCDEKLVQQTCSLFGYDMEKPPSLPPSRSYTISGSTKLGFYKVYNKVN